jgi:hypothetical protein
MRWASSGRQAEYGEGNPDDYWHLHHPWDVSHHRIEKSGRAHEPDLVHGLVERRPRRHHGRPGPDRAKTESPNVSTEAGWPDSASQPPRLSQELPRKLLLTEPERAKGDDVRSANL